MNGRDIRIGDLERDQAITQLHEQFALGRLARDELDERLEAAFRAKTVGDLRTIVVDLPTSTETVAWRHGRQPASLQSSARSAGHREPRAPRMIGLLPFVPFLMFMIVIGMTNPVFLLMPMMMFFWVLVAATAMRSHW